MQDFYLDLVEENKRITPRDYLELALRPVQGGGRDIAAKNEVLSVCFLPLVLITEWLQHILCGAGFVKLSL